jgi:molecular chaperone DnaK
MIICGIDFGTTNSVISYFSNNKPKVLKNLNRKLIPTQVAFYNNKIYCGNEIPSKYDFLINNFKTLIGTDKIYNKKYSINEIVILYLNYLKNLILDKKDNDIKSVISIPANFNDNQREILKKCFEKVGIEVLRIINEPTAAALSYGLLNSIEEENILVIDIGGGTLDITLLEKDELFFEVVDTFGDKNIGGNTFTNIIQSKTKLSWEDSNRIKERLYYKDSITINNITINKTIFVNLVKTITEKIKNYFEMFTKYDIDNIILVGGSSKLFIIQDLVKEIFKKDPLIYKDLQTVVANGACYYGAYLKNKLKDNNDIILLDVLPLSLGVETADGNFSVIIPRNTPLPVERTQRYTTDTPGDNETMIKIYQGERKIANKNLLISEFTFNKISLGGVPVINVTLNINLDGIIKIKVLDKRSSNEKKLILNNIKKVNDKELESIILDAEINLSKDIEEFTKKELIYYLEIRIDEILESIKVNNLINKEQKEEVINELLNNLDNLYNLNNNQLLKLKNDINEKFNNISTEIIDEENESNIEKLLLDEKKEELEELINKIIEEYEINEEKYDLIKETIELIEKTNLTLEILEDKIKYIKNYFNLDNTFNKFNQLCGYLLEEIKNNRLEISKNNIVILKKYILKKISLIENNVLLDWDNEIKKLNNLCLKFI